MKEALLVYLPSAWLALTFVVNAIFHAFTPQDVDAWAERNPKLAQVAAIFRKLGIEPVALFTLVMHFFAANPAMPKLGNASMGKLLPAGPDAGDPYRSPPSGEYDTPKPPATLFQRMPWPALLFVAGFLVCSAFACGIAAAVPAAERLAQCEADVAHEHPGLDFADFVAQSLASCGGDAGVLVVDILEAIVASRDPNVVQYQREAKATRADTAKLGALRYRVRHQ